MTEEENWLDMLIDDAAPDTDDASPMLRQRGGGATAHRAGEELALVTVPREVTAKLEVSDGKDTKMEVTLGAPPLVNASVVAALPKESLTVPQSSCVPAGFEWITKMQPPPRLKRSRKSTDAADSMPSLPLHNDADAFASIAGLMNVPNVPNVSTASSSSSSRAASSSSSGGSSARRPSRRGGASTARSPAPKHSAHSTVPAAASTDADTTTFGGVGGLVPLPIPAPPPSIAKTEAAPESATEEKATSFDVKLHTTSFGMHEAPKQEAPADMVYKKVRHNLTERKRVDRLNQLFNRLSAAVEEPDESTQALLTLECDSDAPSSTDGKTNESAEDVAPKKERSKAEVLEGALSVIKDLRKQLAEERLARSLGMTDLETIAGMCSDDGLNEETAYQNVTW